MRFPGFSSKPDTAVRLLGPLGKEHKCQLHVQGDELRLCTKHGQVGGQLSNRL